VAAPPPEAPGEPWLSIVIPVLNEPGLADLLESLEPLRGRGAELIVVDGGSADGTVTRAVGIADRIVVTAAGRARQQNAGAELARGDALLFLHADTQLPDDAMDRVRAALAVGGWGRFDLALTGRGLMFRVIERMVSLRSRLTGIATGDQAIFVRRDLFERADGFPEIPLMEDVALSRRLRRAGRPVCLRARVTTSSRRWETRGVWRTILLMWRLRLAYWLGADPARLAARYR
jgi:rSAM/selenodomain-associated transferase 2